MSTMKENVMKSIPPLSKYLISWKAVGELRSGAFRQNTGVSALVTPWITEAVWCVVVTPRLARPGVEDWRPLTSGRVEASALRPAWSVYWKKSKKTIKRLYKTGEMQRKKPTKNGNKENNCIKLRKFHSKFRVWAKIDFEQILLCK